jgi:hypothetical protein
MGAKRVNALLGQRLRQSIRVAGFVINDPFRVLARPTGAVTRDGNGVQGWFLPRHFRWASARSDCALAIGGTPCAGYYSERGPSMQTPVSGSYETASRTLYCTALRMLIDVLHNIEAIS